MTPREQQAARLDDMIERGFRLRDGAIAVDWGRGAGSAFSRVWWDDEAQALRYEPITEEQFYAIDGGAKSGA